MGEWAVRIWGTPVPQGDLFCTGKRGRQGRHVLVHSNAKTLKPWRDLVELAGSRLAVRDLAGPVGIDITFTIARPASIPLRVRAWPAVKCGDVDKLARAVLDGLTPRHPKYGRKVLGDDSQVCELTARKAYPDTPGAADRLERPGAVIRIYTLL